ncbi:terminase small subunit [Enterobacter roggenkampii]|uniref:terminase small subunit n=1 Tax=Enterobacter roggenkampii TaxID=1812935 RepID=UPI0021D05ED7|nr:terminase small subunit [Enterobacter roggenkampii]MCU6164891.1 terminase small subunit [Enterobacter roggenkampii]
MSNLDWEAIRREYETDGVSARKLAVKHGISHTAINQKSKAEGWQKPARKPTGQKSSTVKVSTKKMETKKVETPKLETGKSQRLSDERVSDAEADNQSEDVDDLGFEPRDFGLSDQQALFVFWYVKTKNRVEAYKKAGYKCEGKNLHFGAAQIYRNIKVSRAIKALAKRMRQRYTADLDEIVDQLVAITRADPNLVSQYRRVNCRFCWGEENKYQWRDESEYEAALSKAADNGKPPPEDGGTGFIDNADPNPDCPRCQGEGKGQMIISDTRDLEGDELMYYLGVKQTKNGLEVLTESKQAARAALIRILEIKEANKPAVPVVPEEDYQLQPLNTDEPTPDNPIL